MNDIPDPVLKWLEEVNLLPVILWCAALVTLAGAGFRAVKGAIPAIKKLIELSESLEKLPAWMDSTDTLLKTVHHEVLPNNGGSLRDDVQMLSMQLEQLKAHQDNDYKRLGELEDTINRRVELREQARTAPIIPPTQEEE